jgi:hypothetical protein
MAPSPTSRSQRRFCDNIMMKHQVDLKTSLIRIVTILSLMLLANLAFAQVDSTKHVNTSPILADTVKQSRPIKPAAKDSIPLPKGKIDSLSIKAHHKTDSINKQLKKLQSFQPQVPGSSTTGSIQNVISKDLSKPFALTSTLNHNLSSLSPQKRLALFNKRVKKLEKRMQHRIDSISKLKTKDPKTMKSSDSIKHKLDSIKKAGPVQDIREAEQKLAKLESGANSKIRCLEGKVNQELADLKKMGVNTPNLNVPNVNVPNLNVPGLNTSNTNPNSNLNLNTSLPNESIPALGNSTVPSTGSLTNTTPGMNTSTSGLTNDVLPSGEVQTLEKDAGQLTKATGELGQAEKGIQNVNTTTLEQDAQNVPGMKQLSAQTMQADQYKKMVEKWESDPEYRKEMAITQAKQQVINHFAGNEKQLLAVVQKQSSLKAKYKNAEGVVDLFKKPVNPMKGKPLIERLRPGFNLQYQSKQDVLIDFNPQVGYRFSGRLTVGMGWNERWGFTTHKTSYNSLDHIFGPRAYAQVQIKTGLYALATPDMMNAMVPPTFSSPDPGTRKWVWSWMAGMKKEFRYSKKVLGSAQVLYNIYDPGHQSPYVGRLNIRMGFEFPLRKKQKTGAAL